MIKIIFSSCLSAIAVLFLQFFMAGVSLPINLALILVIFWSLSYKIWEILPAVILLGKGWDSFFGISVENLIVFLLVTICVWLLAKHLSLSDPLTPAIIIFSGLLLNVLFYFLSVEIFSWFGDFVFSPLGHFSFSFYLSYLLLNFFLTYGLFRLFCYRKIKHNYGSRV